MVQMLSRAPKVAARPKPRPTPKLQNTTIRDFGGGLNVVDSEQNLTSKFAPVFDNMITYTDRRVGPRPGYEMWLKLKQGGETAFSAADMSISVVAESRVVTLNITHGLTGSNAHITINGWEIPFNGITEAMINGTHGVRRIVNANALEIVVTNSALAAGTSAVDSVNFNVDTHALGGEPIECKYFANYVIVWTSIGEILRIDRDKNMQLIWSSAAAFALVGNPIAWTKSELIASDIFGKELICCNGRDKPLSIDFTRTDIIQYLVDPGNSSSNAKVPAFDACKSAFRYFTIHDTEIATQPEYITSIRIAAKDTAMVYSDAPGAGDAVDIDMSKVVASPEQTVRGFATIKDTILVIQPTATTLMKYGAETTVAGGDMHDPQPVDTLNSFGTSAPRSIVEIGSDVFMIDFNGVPSAKLSSVNNSVIPERVSNYIESMMSAHIGRLKKETMRLKTFGFFDGKNKCVHFYLPKFDVADNRLLTIDPFYFDRDMAVHNELKNTLIMRIDDHQLEEGDFVKISRATGFGGIIDANINGERKIYSVLNENYVMIEIGTTLIPATPAESLNGGGKDVLVEPVIDGTIGYIYHYVPQLKLTAWSRFKTNKFLRFNCGCNTVEGRVFLFTPDGFMMRYGSPDYHVTADWHRMYDFAHWTSGQKYIVGDRVYDGDDDLVYKCIEEVTTTAPSFSEAREIAIDSWEEYLGEPIDFAWELPWADFGARQLTKALRFAHLDATGSAEFTLSLFSDNIYKDADTGKLKPARNLTFVPNDTGAYGSGAQVYGAGRRTREQKLWQMPVRFKLMKARVSGSSVKSLSINAVSFLYQRGSVVRG
jgi:hypothetical protein